MAFAPSAPRKPPGLRGFQGFGAALRRRLASLEGRAPEPLVVVWRALREFQSDNLSIVAAGIAFHILLALLPALAAFVALYGLVGDPRDLPEQLRFLRIVLPPDIVRTMAQEMVKIAAARSGGLSIAAAAGFGLAVWSANGAMRSMFTGLNLAYELPERRGFLRLTLTSLAFTLGLLVLLAATVAGLSAGVVVGALLGHRAQAAFEVARWPALVVAFAFGLSLLHRFGPSGRRAHWRALDWGTAGATLAWLGLSAALSLWFGSFAHLDRTYGSLGAAIGLMTWLWLSAAIVLAGTELNCELER